MAEVLQAKEASLTFLKKKHELDGVIKSLRKASDEAVDLLVAIMNDEKRDIKMRKDCAMALLGFRKDMEQVASDDQLRRLAAEFKIKPGGAAKTLSLEDGKPQAPLLDFVTIRKD